MEKTTQDNFNTKLTALRLQYVDGLEKKKSAMHLLWKGLNQTQFCQAQAEELAQLLHNLIGSGGLYGFPDISKTALALEKLVIEMIAGGQLGHDVCTLYEDLFDQLEQAMNQAAQT